ncbi:MAG TPA: hypothetical protein VMF11_12770 [Candidatus Baltobacteraceae bacterium]|nr:hypothetical protein [Candidatus Baltobacteraceae bacterium]
MFLPLVLAAIGITPWNGTDLPTATQAAAKYRLTVSGKPGATIHLHTSDVAQGWIAAFCDMKVCSPTQVTETIPKSGTIVLQFELIRETEDAPHRSGAVITASDGSRLVVPAASR